MRARSSNRWRPQIGVQTKAASVVHSLTVNMSGQSTGQMLRSLRWDSREDLVAAGIGDGFYGFRSPPRTTPLVGSRTVTSVSSIASGDRGAAQVSIGE